MPKESRTTRITKLVDNAVAMQAVIKDAQAKLDETKAELRALAIGEFTSEQTKIVYAGSSGVAEVIYVADRPKFVNGANPRSLLEIMGGPVSTEDWQHLFVEEVKLAPDFMARLKLMNKATQGVVQRVVQLEPCEPRVTIR